MPPLLHMHVQNDKLTKPLQLPIRSHQPSRDMNPTVVAGSSEYGNKLSVAISNGQFQTS
jgi:phosphoribosylformylglycinamidine (FGAM) synthase-like enzyme